MDQALDKKSQGMHVFNNTRALLTLEEKNFYQASRIMKSMPFYVNTRPT